ncbi:MFS transporter [Aspergillus luchuensis]|uniref:MFS transporter n=1 Tax=Aspergillus kawachii TaxID=1069201 RepID=A0A146F4X5_ASPKA|nr:MFS transporter [Aspergillus luchuensis]
MWYRGYGPSYYVYDARKGPRKFLGGAFKAARLEDFK